MVQVSETEKIITKALNAIDEKDYKKARKILNSVYDIGPSEKYSEGISINLS